MNCQTKYLDLQYFKHLYPLQTSQTYSAEFRNQKNNQPNILVTIQKVISNDHDTSEMLTPWCHWLCLLSSRPRKKPLSYLLYKEKHFTARFIFQFLCVKILILMTLNLITSMSKNKLNCFPVIFLSYLLHVNRIWNHRINITIICNP